MMLSVSYQNGRLNWHVDNMCHNAYAVYVDGQCLVKDWTQADGSGKIDLDTNRSHDVKVVCLVGDSATAVISAAEPTPMPTMMPTMMPTAEPTMMPTMMPTAEPTMMPTAEPTPVPTMTPEAPEGPEEHVCSATVYSGEHYSCEEGLVETMDPTCTAEGYTEYKCRNCGDTYRTDTTEKLPHSCGEYISNNDATCAHDGTKTGKCTVCGEKVTVTDEGTALPHTWTDATCEKSKTCKFCGATEGEPLGHDLKYYNAKAPTCENVGWDAYEKCLRCNHSTFARLPALGHDYRNGVCIRCGDRDGSIVPGEVTGDGKIDMADAYQIILYLSGKAELTEVERLAADANGDGRVDMLDVCRVMLTYKETIGRR
jgi:hypothetical protein